LVVGKGADGPEKEIWARSVENIKKAIPLAAELGVSIVIEERLEPIPLRSRR